MVALSIAATASASSSEFCLHAHVMSLCQPPSCRVFAAPCLFSSRSPILIHSTLTSVARKASTVNLPPPPPLQASVTCLYLLPPSSVLPPHLGLPYLHQPAVPTSLLSSLSLSPQHPSSLQSPALLLLLLLLPLTRTNSSPKPHPSNSTATAAIPSELPHCRRSPPPLSVATTQPPSTKNYSSSSCCRPLHLPSSASTTSLFRRLLLHQTPSPPMSLSLLPPSSSSFLSPATPSCSPLPPSTCSPHPLSSLSLSPPCPSSVQPPALLLLPLILLSLTRISSSPKPHLS